MSTAEQDQAFKPGWAGLAGLLLCAVLPTISLFTIGLALPQVAAAFPDTPNVLLLAQLAGGATGLGFAIGSPLAGWLVERFGVRTVYTASLVAFVLLGIAPALLNNLYLIIALRLVLGFAVVCVTTAGMTGLALLPAEIRGRMFGHNALLSIVGALVTFPVAGVLANIDWHLVFLLHLVALPIIPLALTLPRTMPRAAQTEAAATGILGGAPIGIVLLAGFIGLSMCLGPLFSAFYLASIDVTDPKLVSIPLTAMPAAGLIVTACYGFLHGRLGSKALFALIVLLNGIGLLVAGAAPALAMFTFGMILVSLGQSAFFPTLGAYMAEVCAGSPSRALGVAMSALFGAQAIFPFVSTPMMSALGPGPVYLVFGAISLVLVFVFGGALLKVLRTRTAPEA